MSTFKEDKKSNLSIAVGVINDELELAEKTHKESEHSDELERSLKVVKDYLQDLLDDFN